VSVAFTWERSWAEKIAAAWREHYIDVQVGGPAYKSFAADFVPGRFLKAGCTITSRGREGFIETGDAGEVVWKGDSVTQQIQAAIDTFHSHLDVCVQCRENPFGLCPTGSAHLKAVGAVSRGVLIAQNDDPELLEWLANAQQRGGGFVSSLAKAGLVADPENYPLIRPLILHMRAKYTEYEPSKAVKQELRDRGART
jgi:hypothetical protein